MQTQTCFIDHFPYFLDLLSCDYFLLPKLKRATKRAFYVDIPATQAAVTQVLKKIVLDDMKEFMYKLFNPSKCYVE